MWSSYNEVMFAGLNVSPCSTQSAMPSLSWNQIEIHLVATTPPKIFALGGEIVKTVSLKTFRLVRVKSARYVA